MAIQFKKSMQRVWQIIKKAIIVMFVSSLLYIIVCKWVMPPITITQISNSFGYGLKRDFISYDAMGYNIKLAAIASEDQLFPDHNGFDWDAIEKSFKPRKTKKNKKSKIPLGGGASTISQQTAKNIFLWQGGGVIRKIPEFYFTQMIEWIWGKERILEVYLNSIEMGPGIFGIEAAAQNYFHKPSKKLTRSEAAMIIACLPNPKKFTVVPMSNRVSWRYAQIVHQMALIEDDEDLIAIIK
jgi:monofunctional biosynthetic peptidoglycan transglycosylase